MTVTSKTIEHIKVECRNTAGALASALTEVPPAAQLLSVDTVREDWRLTDPEPRVWIEARFVLEASADEEGTQDGE